MKVGTDGVLLGAWADCENANWILDIGSGTGLVALMLAQRCDANVDAVEIDLAAARQAKQNFQNSPWGNRLNVFYTDANNFQPTFPYDLIVSNPPFFKNKGQIKKPERSLARTGESLSHEKVIDFASEWLHESGKLAMICPAGSFQQIEKHAHTRQMYLTTQLNVRGNPDSEIVRCLVEFSFNPKKLQVSELVIETKRHVYTAEYKHLTRGFYLNF